MNRAMTHVSEEDLVLAYYGEHGDRPAIAQHLASCARCRGELDRLTRTLALVDAEGLEPAEAPGPGYEREVWARLQPQLAEQRGWWRRLAPGSVRGWALAGGVASLVLVAFLAGRWSRPVPAQAPPAPSVTTAEAGVTERVLVLAVVDHLDQSQLVLLELLNSDPGDPAEFAAERSLARELVAANRLYRQTAAHAGDVQTTSVLDELERTLIEIANTPDTATPDDLDALRARIAERGLLFKVRVIHSELRERERQTWLSGSTS